MDNVGLIAAVALPLYLAWLRFWWYFQAKHEKDLPFVVASTGFNLILLLIVTFVVTFLMAALGDGAVWWWVCGISALAIGPVWGLPGLIYAIRHRGGDAGP